MWCKYVIEFLSILINVIEEQFKEKCLVFLLTQIFTDLKRHQINSK